MGNTLVTVDPAAKSPGRIRRNWNRVIKGSVTNTIKAALPLAVNGTGQLTVALGTNPGLNITNVGLAVLLNGTNPGLNITSGGLAVLLNGTNSGLSITSGGLAVLLNGTTLAEGAGGLSVSPNLLLTTLTTSADIVASHFQTSTPPAVNSTGTVVLVAKDTGVATPNAGWLQLKRSDGVVAYVPYWT